MSTINNKCSYSSNIIEDIKHPSVIENEIEDEIKDLLLIEDCLNSSKINETKKIINKVINNKYIQILKQTENLSYVPHKYQTIELINLSLCFDNGYLNIKYANHNLLTIDFIEKHLESLNPLGFNVEKNNLQILKYIPTYLLEYNNNYLCKYAINIRDGYKYLPEHLQHIYIFEYIKNYTIYFPSIDKKFQTNEIILFVIKKYPEFFKYVDLTKITQEICDIAFEKYFENFKYISHEFQTSKMVERVIATNCMFLEYVNPILITQEICQKIFNLYNVSSMVFIDKKYQTEEMVKQYIMKTKKLDYVNINLATIDLIHYALNYEPSNFIYVPHNKQTQEMIKKSIFENRKLFPNINPLFITKEIYDDLCKTDIYCLIENYEIIPKEFYINNLNFINNLLYSYNYNNEIINFLTLEHIIKLNESILKIIIKNNKSMINKIPIDMISPNLFIQILEDNIECIYNIEHLSFEVIICLICNSGRSLKFIPDKFRTTEVLEFAIKINKDNLKFCKIEYFLNNNLYKIEEKECDECPICKEDNEKYFVNMHCGHTVCFNCKNKLDKCYYNCKNIDLLDFSTIYINKKSNNIT